MKAKAGCGSAADPAELPVDEARRRIRDRLTEISACERLSVRAALGRVLAQDLVSDIDVPSATNSAMDGYAVRADDLPASGNRTLRINGTALAGQPCEAALAPGCCVRIMTGALLPAGADTVIAQEQVERRGEEVLIEAGHRPQQNVRLAGEDLAKGRVAIPAGTRLWAAQLGLLASLGVAEVSVRRRPRVAFFSTGDELRSIGEPLAAGEVYDSNRYTLYGMLSRLGVEMLDLGVVRDRPETIEAAFLQASVDADVVIASGGVSVGEADYVRNVLARLGQVDFWKIAIKPGRPLAFGRIGKAIFFGLPGNPVAVMVTFYQFVQPALRRLAGEKETVPMRFRVPCLTRLKKRPGRTEFQRGLLTATETGVLGVGLTGKQGSGILSSMSTGDCFIVLPPENAGIEPGELVEVEPFSGLV